MAIASVNPATGQTLRSFEELSAAQLEDKLALASRTFSTWRKVPFSERAALLTGAARLLETEKGRWARLMVEEMGKPRKSAVAEAEKCAWVCHYYAQNAQTLLADRPVATDSAKSFIRHLPLGPVLAVMPWNFPFWQVFRFAAPALMAGNVGLLKHASNVPQCALAIEEIFSRAGFPKGAFQTLLIGSGKVAALIDDPRVTAVTLTGSEPAGMEVAARAGRQIKKTVLELGGSDPFIVLPSADVDTAAKLAVAARTLNNGQSCIAAKRFIVHHEVYAKFERLFVEHLERLKVGNPLDDDTEIGPLATPGILDEVAELVDDALSHGAKLLSGGKRLPGPGNFYAPSALAQVPKSARAYREELFGPVACLYEVKTLDEAIAVANDTPFGLASCAFTRDEQERARLVDELEAGLTFINGMVVSDPRLPFGGIKRSGYGRELAEEGIKEFVNIKTVVFKD